MPRHLEDPAIKSGVDDGGAVAEELHPEGCEQGLGCINAPRHYWSGVGCGQPSSREGGRPRPELDEQGGDTSVLRAWGQGGRAAKAELHTASDRRVSILNLL